MTPTPAASATVSGGGDQRVGSGFFAHQAPAIRAALKTTVACVLATLIVMSIHVPHEAWALVTVIVLSAPEVGASFQKGTLRLSGTVAGAALGVAMIDWFSQYPGAFALIFFAIAMFASYKATGPRFPYMYVIGLVTFLIVAVQALSQPTEAESIALTRCAEVMIGVIATILVTLSLWPVRASDTLHDKLAEAIADCRTLLASEMAALGSDGVVTRLLGAPLQHRALLQVARSERDVSGPRFERLGRATELAARVIDATLVADATHRFAGLPGPTLPGSAARGRGLMSELEALADALRASSRAGAPVPPAAVAGGQREDPHAQAAVSAGIDELSRHVGALASRTPNLGPGRVAEPPDEAADGMHLPGGTPMPRVDRARLLHAFKVALALQLALWFWAIFHLPAGMQAMVTVFIVSQKTLGASELKSTLRLAGAFVGGTIGILVASFVIPMISSIAALTFVIAPIIFACIWVNDGSKRFGYAGFQAAFAFILTLIGGPRPTPDVMAPIERFTGVLIGIVIALLTMRSIAPADAAGGARTAIARLLEASGVQLRRILQGMGAKAPGSAEDAWKDAAEAVRDEAVTHLDELREGTASTRRMAARLDPQLNLVSRLVAVIAALDRRVSARRGQHASEHVVGELTQLASALETACTRLGTAIRSCRSLPVDSAMGEALRTLEARVRATAPPPAGARATDVSALPSLVGCLRTCVGLLAAIAAETVEEQRLRSVVPELSAAASA